MSGKRDCNENTYVRRVKLPLAQTGTRFPRTYMEYLLTIRMTLRHKNHNVQPTERNRYVTKGGLLRPYRDYGRGHVPSQLTYSVIRLVITLQSAND